MSEGATNCPKLRLTSAKNRKNVNSLDRAACFDAAPVSLDSAVHCGGLKSRPSAAIDAENVRNLLEGAGLMDLRKLKKLIDLVQESGIAELEITEGEEKVKIVKSGAAAMLAAPLTPAAPLPASPAVPAAPAGPAAEPAAAQEGHVVKAP